LDFCEFIGFLDIRISVVGHILNRLQDGTPFDTGDWAIHPCFMVGILFFAFNRIEGGWTKAVQA